MRISDWSSDVCSSDLFRPNGGGQCDNGSRWDQCAERRPWRLYRFHSDDRPVRASEAGNAAAQCHGARDRKSVVWGKSVSVRVDLGGRRIIKKKKQQNKETNMKLKKDNTTEEKR